MHTRIPLQRPSLFRRGVVGGLGRQGDQDQDWEELWACLGSVSGGEGHPVGGTRSRNEEPSALGSLFQPLSWLLVHFLAKVCSARHPGPFFVISGNPEGPFSPQKPFGAWYSGLETSLLQFLLLPLLFCSKSCPNGNRGQPCPPTPVPVE